MAAMRNSELVNTLREIDAVVERIIKLFFQKKERPLAHLGGRGVVFIKSCVYVCVCVCVEDILR
jgi:hypothetical protein